MKKFTVPCRFGEIEAPFDIYVGQPVPGAHPLEQQAAWLQRERGGTVPAAVLDRLQELYDAAVENDLDFAELCMYALTTSDG